MGGKQSGSLIVEHWRYRASRAPSRHIFEEWEEFEAYLVAEAFAGDAVDVWSFATLCRPDRRIAEGKCLAEDGMVPKGSAADSCGLLALRRRARFSLRLFFLRLPWRLTRAPH
jgi:hypothetical protein